MFCFFAKKLIVGIFHRDLGSGGVQSIGNGCGIQIDQFSAHLERYESISDDFHDFDDFAIIFDDLTLFREGLRTLRDCPAGLGTL